MKTKNLSQDAEPLYDSQHPARQVLQIIADTWTPIVLFCMRGRTRRFCTYPAHELKKSDILRVATASNAAALLDEMDTVMRQREQATDEENIAPASGPSADAIISHMSAYMETATP
jgi:hypothetical protein